MMLVRGLLPVAAFGTFALSAPVGAQDADSASGDTSAICAFHGDGCDADPSEWQWVRSEPEAGIFSVEIPCTAEQADTFGVIVSMSKAPFQPTSTRACMKGSSGFIAGYLGLPELPEGATPSEEELDELLQGEPDMFAVMVKKTSEQRDIPQVSMAGRRAIVNTIERDKGFSRVAIIDVSRFGLLTLTADIRDDLDVTRSEGEALVDRFFESLEFTQ